MHELAIAESIVSIAERHARGRRVLAVEVEVGHLRQVVPASLAFAFELVAKGTAADGAELRLVPVPAELRCRACGAAGGAGAFPLTCPACGGLDVEVLRGEELLVAELELDDQEVVCER